MNGSSRRCEPGLRRACFPQDEILPPLPSSRMLCSMEHDAKLIREMRLAPDVFRVPCLQSDTAHRIAHGMTI